MLNNVQIASLHDFAKMRYPVGARAMALLNLNNALDYNEPLFVPEEGDKSYSGGKKLSSLQEDNLLVLFPNPSSQFFTVEYSLKESFNSGKLIILDVSGKIVQQTKINYSRDQILISTNNWPSGIYSCTLLIDGLTALTQQVTVIK